MAVNRKSELMLQNLKGTLSDDSKDQRMLLNPFKLEKFYNKDILWELNQLSVGLNKNTSTMEEHHSLAAARTLPPLNVPDAIRHLSLADTKQLKLFQKRHNFLVDRIELMNKSEYVKQKKRTTTRLNSLDDSHLLSHNLRTFRRNSQRKPSLFDQKDAAMLNLSLDSKLWNMKQSLEMMGTPPKTVLPNVHEQILNRSMDKQSKRKRTISKRISGDDLAMIAESESESTGLLSYRGTMTDSDSSLGLNASRRSMPRHRRKRAAKLARKWKRLSKFMILFFGLWRIHAAKVKDFLDTNVDLIEIEEPIDLLFDVTEYKADKQACVSQDTKRILKKDPKKRTTDEVKYVQVALRNYQSIEEYPIKMTSRLAEKAWFEKYDSKRIIIQQSHPARCFYFILSGSVVVSKMDEEYGVSRTVCFLNRGEHFGELGLINNAPRQATVISKEPVELLVINDEDYVEIFMGGGIKGSGDNFIEDLWCFEGWPIEILPEHPTESFLSYFKRNIVLAHDSRMSDWIYIIKSGSCTVIKKLREVSPTRKGKKTLAVTNNNDTEQEDETSAEQHHASLIQKAEADALTKSQKRSLQFRQKELKELKLGVELLSVSTESVGGELIITTEPKDSPESNTKEAEISEITDDTEEDNPKEDEINSTEGELNPIQEEPQTVIKSETSEKQEITNSTESQDKNETKPKRKISTVKQLAPKRKTSLSGPFMKLPIDKVTDSDKKQRRKSVSRLGGDNKKKISFQKPITDEAHPAISEDTKENESAKDTLDVDDENTARIRREFEEIIRGDAKRSKKAFKPEKKTISDELNKNYLKMKHGDTPEDLHPTFVRVQTLTKGSVFGLTDLVHYDQPSLSLVSNGAECIVIRKKFFQDHCSVALMSKIRQMVSPFPNNEEIQSNLQTYVNWVNQKEQTMRDAMLWNRVKKVDVHNARSVLSFREETAKEYKIGLV